MERIRIANTLADISRGVEQVEKIIKAWGVKSEHLVQSTLTLEETLVRIMERTEGQDVSIQIAACKSLRKRYLRISYKGDVLRTSDLFPPSTHDEVLNEAYGPEAEAMIRDMVIRANADRLNCRHSGGVNTITILVSKTDKALIYDTLLAIGIGMTAGLGVRFLATPDATEWISSNLFMPFYEVFITVISMIIAPFIFFSLTSSIAGFGDMSALGRTGAKVFGCYLLTTLLGTLICIGMFYALAPGLDGGLVAQQPDGAAGETLVLSPMEKLLSVIPTSFVGSFVENDMLKIMFLAILTGISLSRPGKYADKLKESFNAFNDLFSRVTTLLSGFLPIAIFGSTAHMAATLDVNSIDMLLSWIGYMLLCIFLQLCLYMVLLVVMGRLNPLPFLRKFSPAMLTALFTSSSSVTIPTSQECCRKMGITPRVYSFSIPLGANINMDGTSLMFCGTALFMANMYGLTIPPSALLSLVCSVMLISVALPGVPGAGTACMLMVFAILGVPAEAFGLVIGLCPLLELVETSLNVTGDGAMTTIVASSEKLLDKQAYYAKD